MGLFENIGRKVEEFKQEAQSVSERQATGKCEDCGELLYTDREDCPECGGERIRRPEPESETGSGDDDADATSGGSEAAARSDEDADTE